ncbi:hypothetical protein E2562_022477 [Oryza meyeriana var. granulata]|uniref:Uncharacterized protein n=1 Tax=Oryza meyeriana var. granulata TaxID=110450 RepID=A0A6G1BLK6_9ORYZ|nr:hypothetical protein E2562_022477 [Oryza meyeriana var. granulata]
MASDEEDGSSLSCKVQRRIRRYYREAPNHLLVQEMPTQIPSLLDPVSNIIVNTISSLKE